MAQLNTCLKRTFLAFNLLFAVFGSVLVVLVLLCITFHPESTQVSGLISLLAIGSGIVVLTGFGAFGVHQEKKGFLVVCFTGMSVGFLYLLLISGSAADQRPQLEETAERTLRGMLPLDQAPPGVRNMAQRIQLQLHCCGLFSHGDWRQPLPDSCSCQPTEEEEWGGRCEEVTYNLYDRETGGRDQKMVYRQTCFPFIMRLLRQAMDVVLGVLFGIAALALLGAVMSFILLMQLRVGPSKTPVVFSVTPQPPKYSELYQSYCHAPVTDPAQKQSASSGRELYQL